MTRGKLAAVFILIMMLVGSFSVGQWLLAAPENKNHFKSGGVDLILGGDGFCIGGDVQLYRSAANTWGLGAGDSLIGATWLNSTNSASTNFYMVGGTAGRIPLIGTNGRIVSDADLTFSVDTLTATKLAGTTMTGDITMGGNDIIGATWLNSTNTSTSSLYVNGEDFTGLNDHLKSGSTASVVDGTWIAHGLGHTPTSVVLTSKTQYFKGAPVILSVLDSNSTKFKVGVTTASINNLFGITPTAATFDTAPTNLAYTTDNDYTTVTGTGDKSFPGTSGTIGTLTYDMGAPCAGSLDIVANVHRNSGNGNAEIDVYYSADGVNYYWQGLRSSGVTFTDQGMIPCHVNFIYARYIRLVFTSSSVTTNPSTYHVIVGEVQLIQTTGNLAVTATGVTVDWMAKYKP